MVNWRRLRWARGENLALRVGQLLQALLEPLPAPGVGLGQDFTFDIGQRGPAGGLGTGRRFQSGFGLAFHWQ
jgi:hypothetical protein